MKIVWSPLAVRRALEAVAYIARERPGTADDWREGLLDRVERLERFPRSGHAVPEIADLRYREFPHAPYRVIYRVEQDRVVILTLRHARRAWDSSEVADGL